MMAATPKGDVAGSAAQTACSPTAPATERIQQGAAGCSRASSLAAEQKPAPPQPERAAAAHAPRHAREGAVQPSSTAASTTGTSRRATAVARASSPAPAAPAAATDDGAAAAGTAHGHDPNSAFIDDDAAEDDVLGPDPVPGDFPVRRRRAAFAAMLLLLERGARDDAELVRLLTPMSGDELEQTAEERALAGVCGNPLCRKPWKYRQPREWWGRAAELHVPPPRSSFFCCDACEAVVAGYAEQMGDPGKRLKPSVRQLMSLSHTPRRPGQEHVAAQGGGVATMLSEVRERDPAEAAAGAAAASEALLGMARSAAGASSVEGYVPAARAGAGPVARGVAEKSVIRGATVAAGVAAVRAGGSSSSSSTALAAGAAAPHDTAAAGQSRGERAGPAGDETARPQLQHAAAQVQQSDEETAADQELEGKASEQGAQLMQDDEQPAPPAPVEQKSAAVQGALRSSLKKHGERPQPRTSSGGAGAAESAAAAASDSVAEVGDEDYDDATSAALADSAELAEKHVRFAPKVEYQMPSSQQQQAQPGPAARQPVLVFSVGDGSSGDGISLPPHKGPAIKYGTLQVADADELELEGLSDGALQEAMSAPAAGGRPPAALRMWFPPAAGGLGVSRKRDKAKTVQQQEQQQTPAPDSAAAAAVKTASACSSGHRAGSPLHGSGEAGTASPAPPAPKPAAPIPGRAADPAAAAAAATGGSSSGPSQPAKPGGGLRRFLPTGPPRRHVVHLDRAPAAGAAVVAVQAPGSAVQTAGVPRDAAGHPPPGLGLGSGPGRDMPASTTTTTTAPAATSAQPEVLPRQVLPGRATPAGAAGGPLDDDQDPFGPAPKPPKVHVVHIRSDKRAGHNGFSIPPELQPGFSDEDDDDGEGGGASRDHSGWGSEGNDDDDDDDGEGGGGRGFEPPPGEGWDPDEFADALYAGSLGPGNESDASDAVDGDGEAEAATTLRQHRGAAVPGSSHNSSSNGRQRAAGGGQQRQEQQPGSASSSTREAGSAEAVKPPAQQSRWRQKQQHQGHRRERQEPRSQDVAPPSSAAAAAAAAVVVGRGPSVPHAGRQLAGSSAHDDNGVAHAPGKGASQGPPSSQHQQQLQKKACAEAVAAAAEPTSAGRDAGGDAAPDDPLAYPLRDDLDSTDDDGGGGSDAETASTSSSTADVNFKSMLPFFNRTTRHYHAQLSPFNEVQLAVCGWVNHRTVAFVQGVGLGPLQAAGPTLADPAYAAEGVEGVPDLSAVQARAALARLLDAPLHAVRGELRVGVAESDISRKVTALISTFRLVGPVPSFKPPQWRLLAVAILHALSIHHLPALADALYAPAAHGGLGPRGGVRAGGLQAQHLSAQLDEVLRSTGFDVHYLRVLVDLLSCPEL